MRPLVSCLCATYGRYSVLQEAVSCFLLQDYENRELIILNNHEVPIVCDLPRVFVINDVKLPTLGDCRNYLLNRARGRLIRTWDDDDYYMPWAISQGVEHITSDMDIWQPNKSWSWHKAQDRMLYQGNVYEASWTAWTNSVCKVGYKHGGGDEHRPLRDKLRRKRTELGPGKASYIYTWASGLCHISGTLGDERGIQWRTERWKKLNDDHGNEQLLEPIDLTYVWERVERALNELGSTTCPTIHTTTIRSTVSELDQDTDEAGKEMHGESDLAAS